MEYALPLISGTPSQWAKVTHWSRTHLYEMVRNKELEARRDGTKTVISAESILKRLKALPPLDEVSDAEAA